MTKPIGATFPAELATAGLLGKPFSWTADGALTFDPSMSAEDVAAVQAVYDAHDPTKPTPAQLLAEKLAAGLAVTSTGTPAISATYALDQETLDEIRALASDCAAGLGYPSGAATFAYPDAAGTPRTFTPPQMIALYKAMRDFVAAAKETAATLQAGGAAEWPPATATIA